MTVIGAPSGTTTLVALPHRHETEAVHVVEQAPLAAARPA